MYSTEDIADYIVTLIAAFARRFSMTETEFITGENICIAGGMTRQMIYHGNHGWERSNKYETQCESNNKTYC